MATELMTMLNGMLKGKTKMALGIYEDGSDTTERNHKKHKRLMLKLNSVINAIDHFDIRERTGYNIQVDRDYVENLRSDVKESKRSLSDIEVRALNEIWRTYKGGSSTSQISQHIDSAIENKKKKKWFQKNDNLLNEAISDAKAVRDLAIDQAKRALEETFVPGMIHRSPPPLPPPRRRQDKTKKSELKKSELQEIIREEIRKMIKEEEQNKKPPKPKPRKTWV